MTETPETTLQNWARLAGPLKHRFVDDVCVPSSSFRSSFAGFIEKATALREIEFYQLSEIITQTSERLTPLGEPLKQDLGLHRWLSGAREEAYSDWLQWLFAQMNCDELACVLGLPNLLERGNDAVYERVRVDREVWVNHGHEGRLGRLDILIQVGDRAVIALEVKLGSASEADTAKQIGYVKAIESDPKFAGRQKNYVLVVIDADKREICGFKVRTYEIICRNIRRLAIKWMNAKQLLASAVALTVAAAIETNLLRLSLERGSFTPDTLSYLRVFLERDDYE